MVSPFFNSPTVSFNRRGFLGFLWICDGIFRWMGDRIFWFLGDRIRRCPKRWADVMLYSPQRDQVKLPLTKKMGFKPRPSRTGECQQCHNHHAHDHALNQALLSTIDLSV
ncbi:hypothetical protein [Microcoleus sp. CAWBG640]|uniref:hypothetical protein n=1 Tax=Microcoleus sp. CAWBG640 TaxID=2841653 RepID=UPI00312B5883